MSVDDSRHPEPTDPRRSTLPALAGAGAVLAAAGLVVGVALTSGSADTMPVAQAAPSTSTTSTATSTTTSAAASYKADGRGYLDTKARCDESQSVMVYGRTDRSLVAICVDPDGGLEYRGVRLSDNASLTLAATRGADGTVIADNDGGVTYSISPKVFLVSEGDNVIYRGSWIEFVQPGFSGTSTSSSTTATTSGSATTTVSTTTVTVTTSVTPTSKSGG